MKSSILKKCGFMLTLASLSSTIYASDNVDDTGIVYWGNTKTGVAVREINGIDRRERAKIATGKIGGDGWVLLEDSKQTGFGAAMCIRQGDKVLFLVSHGHPTGREAISAAQQKAKAVGGLWSTCSRGLWSVSPRMAQPGSPGITGVVKGNIRSQLVPPHGERDYQRDCVAPANTASAKLRAPKTGTMPPKQDGAATDWQPADWCPRFQKPSGSAVGVRG